MAQSCGGNDETPIRLDAEQISQDPRRMVARINLLINPRDYPVLADQEADTFGVARFRILTSAVGNSDLMAGIA